MKTQPNPKPAGPVLATPARYAMIKALSAAAHGVTVAEIDGRGRPARVALARQHAMAIARGLLVQLDPRVVPAGYVPIAHEKVAAAFNRDDHGTVTHACRVIEELRSTDDSFRERDSILREAVGARIEEERSAAA